MGACGREMNNGYLNLIIFSAKALQRYSPRVLKSTLETQYER